MNEQSEKLSFIFQAAIGIESDEQLAQFLKEACDGDGDLRRQLEVLVEAHKAAGNFLAKPPAQLAATQLRSEEQLRPAHHSVLELIGKTMDAEAPRVVLDSSPAEQFGPIVRPRSGEMPKHDANTRYRLDGEIARGGMGAILKGRDIDLGRDLAVKVLLDEHKHKPAVIQRFVEEAQIGGQLQHPGIVPVYALDVFNDQRPFFTMKLVKGKTLSALLEERGSPEKDRAKFLGIFEQICQTMAYAHSRGVIHRDLKPSNIMVGAFGEVQVMDWGLAKVLTEGGVADERKAFDNRTKTSIIQTIRSLGSDTPAGFGSKTAGSHTQMGSVMGTPAYMPPEQALGEIDRLDQRSDVFGLGAILCEILTGEPPYTGEDHTEVFRKASRAKLEECHSRLDSQDLDDELLQIVVETLRPEPEERPRDAGVLTERVSGHLASIETRMRAAELAKVEANTKAHEERKRRKVILALATSVLVTMGLTVGGWVFVQRKDFALRQAEAEAERERQIENLQDRQRFLSEITTAESLLAGAEKALPSWLELQKVRSALDRAEKQKEMTERLEREDKRRLASLLGRLERLSADRQLLKNLHACWQYENEYETAGGVRTFETIAARPFSLSVEGYLSDSGQQLTKGESPVSAMENPSEKYERAFSDWGLHLSQKLSELESKAKFTQLHADVLPAALVSLDRWREHLTYRRDLEYWRKQAWSILQPVSLRSRGGDTLEVLEDLSILASGNDPHMGYELKFETNATTLVAFRLEALTHESLPNNGPGRSAPGAFYSGATGIFSLQGIEVWYAPRSRPQDRSRLWFKSAVADYSSNFATKHALTTESWMIGGGAGSNHEAVFEGMDPPSDSSGFLHLHPSRESRTWSLGR